MWNFILHKCSLSIFSYIKYDNFLKLKSLSFSHYEYSITFGICVELFKQESIFILFKYDNYDFYHSHIIFFGICPKLFEFESIISNNIKKTRLF